MKIRPKSKSEHLSKSSVIRLPLDYHWKVLSHLTHDLRRSLSLEDYGRLKAICYYKSFERLTKLFEDWGLQTFSMNPSLCSSLDEIRAKYQLASLLKKFHFDETTPEFRKNEAVKVFLTAEILCRNYNALGWKAFAWSEDPEIVNIFTYARSWIERVIGAELPEFGELTLRSRHGPGASSNTTRNNTCNYFKYKDWPYDVTGRARGMAITAIQSDERWIGVLEDDYRKRHKIPPNLILNQDAFWDNVLNVVPGNKIAFVPKSYKIDRTIAIEPTLNLYLQLGVDGFIRRRLKRWNIDLDNQQRNRDYARLGSENGDNDSSFITLDLSMASDTISTTLCRHLLPKSWYHYLMQLRSPEGDLDGKTIRYEKVSSMGNGFTFALESLIFSAIAFACMKEKCGFFDSKSLAVFGDDIIIRKNLKDLMIKSLQAAGFTINIEKSFVQGDFRESCGADWFRGKPVRPVFLKKIPTDIKELFNDYNRLKRTLNLRFGLDEEDLSVLTLLEKWIPQKFKTFYGPFSDEEFDTYLHAKVPKNLRYIHGEFKFNRLIRKPKVYNKTEFGFTKLMATLGEKPIQTFYESHRKLVTQGSTFEVPKSNTWYFAITKSASDFWRYEYAETG